MVPVYGLFVQVNLIDTMHGTSFFLATSQLPFADLADEELHGRRAGGAGGGGLDGRRVLVPGADQVILPLMGPGFAVVTVYSFIQMWGNFFVPFMLLLHARATPGVGQHLHLLRQLRLRGLRPAGGVLDPLLDAGAAAVLVLSRRLGGGFALGGAVKG